jgi:plasmid segregation protein ParM
MVILTGGGVKILEPWFRAFIKDIHIVEDYQLSNARGFYKLGLLLAGEYQTAAAQPNLQAVRS